MFWLLLACAEGSGLLCGSVRWCAGARTAPREAAVARELCPRAGGAAPGARSRLLADPRPGLRGLRGEGLVFGLCFPGGIRVRSGVWQAAVLLRSILLGQVSCRE